jgi:pimeloyl-ACP methyl ester carboxylesterase
MSTSVDFMVNETKIVRRETCASMTDGALLRGYTYTRADHLPGRRPLDPGSRVPLLCLATELGNCREHHDFALVMAASAGASEPIHTLDLRGRGRSDTVGAISSGIDTDADDLISYCDAHDLHEFDVVVSGYSCFVVFHAATKRPGMVRRLILNDASPEFDAVGIARRHALVHMAKHPSSWDEGVDLLRDMKGEEFPEFSDEDWQDLSKIVWLERNGKPVLDRVKGLARFSNVVDYDSALPSMWSQFKLFCRRPTLLIHGEHSALVTKDIAEKMKRVCPDLTIITAEKQGHAPQLHRNGLAEKILAFLLKK